MRKNLSSSGIAILVLAAGIIFLSGMVETPARAATIPEVLHSFTGGTTDGAGPYGSLVLSGGNLYGMSVGGAPTGSARFLPSISQPAKFRSCIASRARRATEAILSAACSCPGKLFTG